MLRYNEPQTINAYALLAALPSASIAACFFDPEYPGPDAKLKYGNKGKGRQKDRFLLPQMTPAQIAELVADVARVLRPSGHLFLWVDKFHLLEGDAKRWGEDPGLALVDMMVWDKLKIGMGYRTRHQLEYLVVFQKPPLRAKGVWLDRAIRDIHSETMSKTHTHAKPIKLIERLICAVTLPGEVICDPAAGGYGVLRAALLAGRQFVGGDLLPCTPDLAYGG